VLFDEVEVGQVKISVVNPTFVVVPDAPPALHPYPVFTAGVAVATATVKMTDLKNNQVFNVKTDATGNIAQQTFTSVTYASTTTSTAQNVGPFNFKAIKYGFQFLDLTKTLTAETSETVTLTTDSFTTEADVDVTLVLENNGLALASSTPIAYGSEATTSAFFTTTRNVLNTPVDQSKFLGIFGYDGTTADTKLVKDAAGANGFTINYSDGLITFNTSQNARQVTFVYSHGGTITATTTVTTAQIYDFVAAKEENVFRTPDGTNYTSYLDVGLLRRW